ncbi:MAG: sugar nucleotide-binding protein [Rhodospirillales bacterium]|nr:sugar nucleotide-binding protein [Rhodospirillales bacterium]
MRRDRILILGGDGVLGSALAAAFAARGIPVLATTRRPDRVGDDRPFFDLGRDSPDCLLPPGLRLAYLMAGNASVEACAKDPSGTRSLNVEAILKAASHLRRAGVRLVYPSTSRVFDGARPRMSAEDRTHPISEYGRQRAEVEERLGQAGGAAILRLTKVLGPRWGLMEDWRDRLLGGQPLHPMRGATIAPVLLRHAVDALMRADALDEGEIAQLSAPDDLAMSEVASLLARHLGLANPGIHPQEPPLDPQGLFPPYSSLDMGATARKIGMAPLPPSRAIVQEWLETHLA